MPRCRRPNGRRRLVTQNSASNQIANRSSRSREIAGMDTITWIIATAPEIFLLLSTVCGPFLGLFKFFVFSVGSTACTLFVALIIGHLGHFVIPPILKAIFFSLFVFTIG